MSSTHSSGFSRKQFAVAGDGPIAVGVDTHGKSYRVCLWAGQEDRQLANWVQPPQSDLLSSKLDPIRDKVSLVAYEAGPTGFGLARELMRLGWPVLVTSPAEVPSTPNQPKSDRRDARLLARMASKNLLKPIHIPSIEHEHERQTQRCRAQALRDRKRVQQRIKSLLLCHGIQAPQGLRYWSQTAVEELKQLDCPEDLRFVLRFQLQAYAYAQAMLTQCDNRLAKLSKRPHNKNDIRILCSAPGIGEKSALEFIVEMGPAGRFSNRLEVSKYQGLAPEVKSSGDTRRELWLNSSGNRRLKTLLVEAAWRWVGNDADAAELYARMMHNTGCAQKAITAVARKLGIILWRMRETSRPYSPEIRLKQTKR